MKQMVDPEGRHWDWDYNTNTWVPARQGVFADAPAGGTPLQTFSQHTTPDGVYDNIGSAWYKHIGAILQAAQVPSALAVPPVPAVIEYVAPDLRDHFNCPCCGDDSVVLRHVIRRTGREQIQCMDCEEWYSV